MVLDELGRLEEPAEQRLSPFGLPHLEEQRRHGLRRLELAAALARPRFEIVEQFAERRQRRAEAALPAVRVVQPEEDHRAEIRVRRRRGVAAQRREGLDGFPVPALVGEQAGAVIAEPGALADVQQRLELGHHPEQRLAALEPEAQPFAIHQLAEPVERRRLAGGEAVVDLAALGDFLRLPGEDASAVGIVRGQPHVDVAEGLPPCRIGLAGVDPLAYQVSPRLVVQAAALAVRRHEGELQQLRDRLVQDLGRRLRAQHRRHLAIDCVRDRAEPEQLRGLRRQLRDQELDAGARTGRQGAEQAAERLEGAVRLLAHRPRPRMPLTRRLRPRRRGCPGA